MQADKIKVNKIKVATLTGPPLNDQVALALGWQQRLWGAIPVWFDPNDENRYRCHVAQWKPSTNPAQAYPIIEREKIGVIWSDNQDCWVSGINGRGVSGGPTAAIAAMRTYVTSNFGEEVDEV